MSDEQPDAYGDPLTRPYWSAAARGELAVQECRECGHRQFYPRPLCLSCGTPDPQWVRVSGDGTVYSLTVVHRQLRPELEPPYAVVLVDLDGGPRMLAGLLDGPSAAVIGDRVKPAWKEREGLPPLLMFRRAATT